MDDGRQVRRRLGVQRRQGPRRGLGDRSTSRRGRPSRRGFTPLRRRRQWRTIVQKERDSYLLHASNSSGALRPAAGVTVGGATSIATDPTAVPVATWTHLALTYDGTQLRLYRNGVQVGVKAASGPIQPTASRLVSATTARTARTSRAGSTEVRVYRVALSPAEIQADMGVPLGGPPDTDGAVGGVGVGGECGELESGGCVVVGCFGQRGGDGVRGGAVSGAGRSSFGLVTTVATLLWSDTGRSPGTSYSYRVRARDAAGMGCVFECGVGGDAAAVDAPPSAPSSLVASASGSTGVGLSWSAATDDLGVSGYEVERCQGSGARGSCRWGRRRRRRLRIRAWWRRRVTRIGCGRGIRGIRWVRIRMWLRRRRGRLRRRRRARWWRPIRSTRGRAARSGMRRATGTRVRSGTRPGRPPGNTARLSTSTGRMPG